MLLKPLSIIPVTIALSACITMESQDVAAPDGQLARITFVRNSNLIAPSATVIHVAHCQGGKPCYVENLSLVEGRSLLEQIAMPAAVAGGAALLPSDDISASGGNAVAGASSSAAASAVGTSTAKPGHHK